MTDQPTALDLPMVDPLPAATQKYFDICQEKLGMVPNVLRAYAFDIDKLNAFTALYNDVMLADSGLSKLEREMIAVAVSAENRCWYCLVAHGAAVRVLSGDPAPSEADITMTHRVADAAQARGRARDAGAPPPERPETPTRPAAPQRRNPAPRAVQTPARAPARSPPPAPPGRAAGRPPTAPGPPPSGDRRLRPPSPGQFSAASGGASPGGS